MAVADLASLPPKRAIFIDSNVFIYSFKSSSAQCARLLQRCNREEVYGFTSLEVVAEVTHQMMLAEAVAKNIISVPYAKNLSQVSQKIPTLSDYWKSAGQILKMNLHIFESKDRTHSDANTLRRSNGLLTNDSLLVSIMNDLNITDIATNDGAFDRVSGLNVYKPTDV